MIQSIILSLVLLLVPAQAAHAEHVAESFSATNVYHDSGDIRAWYGVPQWIRSVGHCIRLHESIDLGHYRADNPTSTASGAYQMLRAMWEGNARWVPEAHPWRYKPASKAPPWIQDKVFIHSVKHGGLPHWSGTHCPGT